VLDRSKEYLPFTKAEERIRDRIRNIKSVGKDFNDKLDDDDDDDDNESTCSSVAMVSTENISAAIDDPSDLANETGWELLSDELKAKEAQESLKKLGNVARRKLHKHALKDVFVDGDILLKKNIGKIRRKALRRKKRKYQLIMMAMKYFERQMTYQRKILDAQMKKIEAKELSYIKRVWEADYRDVMKLRRLKGQDKVSMRKRRK
jgi:hypothetical protein